MFDVNFITAQEVNFRVYKGDFWSVPLVFTDTDDNPIDFTGVEFKMQVKKVASGSFKEMELTNGDGIEISGADNNTVTIEKNPLDIAAGKYKYDLQATLTNGKIVTYIYGVIDVKEDVTR